MFVLNSVMSCIRSKKICKLNKLLNKSDTSKLVGYFRPCFSHSDCHSDLNQQIQQLQIESHHKVLQLSLFPTASLSVNMNEVLLLCAAQNSEGEFGFSFC